MDETRWREVKYVTLARDGHCLRCLGEAEVVHHRVPRGMGGRDDDEINYGLANLVSLCNSCHEWAHSEVDEAYQTGFLLHWWDNPEKFPLTVKPGTFYVTLTKDGDMEITKPVLLF